MLLLIADGSQEAVGYIPLRAGLDQCVPLRLSDDLTVFQFRDAAFEAG